MSVDPLSQRSEPLYPYQYEIVWHLMQQPRTAAQLTRLLSFKHSSTSILGTVNQMRPLLRRGWVRKSESDPASGIYEATERAREAVSW